MNDDERLDYIEAQENVTAEDFATTWNELREIARRMQGREREMKAVFQTSWTTERVNEVLAASKSRINGLTHALEECSDMLDEWWKSIPVHHPLFKGTSDCIALANRVLEFGGQGESG